MHENSLECFLYHSRLADGADATCVGEIVQAARTFNWTAGITGVLVFDGSCFFQYIEGPPEQLKLLIESIAKDRRHVDFTPLYPQARLDRRRFANWSMACVVVNDAPQAAGPGPYASTMGRDMVQALLPSLLH